MFLKLLGIAIVFHSQAVWYLHDLIPYFVELTLGNFKIASPRNLELELRAVNNSEILVGTFPFPIARNIVLSIFFKSLVC